MEDYQFKKKYNIFYTGYYGKQKEPTKKDWNSKITQIN